MNEYREDKPCCYFHPKEVIVGVCPLCLNERLLILASKQGHLSQTKGTTHRTQSVMDRKPHISLPKIFALGSFLNRLDFRHKKFQDLDVDASSSQEGRDLFSHNSIKVNKCGTYSWNIYIYICLEYLTHIITCNF
uniref:Uncharacterized protein n=1 Tax=Davidia involucrata TaxID=16924 RepID=A0A5B7BM97_DAVIN